MDTHENSPGVPELSRKNARSARSWWVLSICVPALAVAVVMASQALQQPRDVDNSYATQAPTAEYPIAIRQPAGPPTVDTGQIDGAGRPIVANCTTCHTTKPPNPRIINGGELQDFHQGLVTNHGNRSCLSCHNPDDYNQLRLADDRPVPFQDVMTLCAQCHGPQYKDYQHGAHGGMTGYWDLTRGPRARNNCIDCHDPHAPQYPRLMPVHRPNDRFLRPPSSENAHE